MSRLAQILAPLVLAAIILAAWEAACRAFAIPIYFLAPPSAIAASLVTDGPALLRATGYTFLEALEALVIASVLAQALALGVALSDLLERAVKPLAVVLQVTPVVAIAPLVNIWAGTDHPQRAVVGLAALVAFFPIYSGAVTGLKAVDPDLARLFDLYSANRWQRLTKLRLPSAVPFLLEGHKVAAGLAIVGAVVAEFVSGSGKVQGLAWQILNAGNRLQTAKMFSALIVLGLLGAALHAVLEALERASLRWWRGR
ncbi:ABC transporter permease [Phenylobacterium sp.]|jgi:NitT/TauT family transport system permease protein|uniref:ABC transporter permease n=1 Tax=Phenylobacterium sp. TaxID=1871053 RepID=UPI002F419E52